MRYLTQRDLNLLQKYGCSIDPKMEDILKLINIAEMRNKDIKDLHAKIEELAGVGIDRYQREMDEVSGQNSRKK